MAKSKKSQWEIERDLRVQANEQGMAGLTKDQLKTIIRVRKCLGSSLGSMIENQDILLSELRDLDTAYHALCRNFNLEHGYWSEE